MGQAVKFRFMQRVYFSVQHIKSAECLALSCSEVEKNFDGKLTGGLLNAHSALVTGSIFMSVAFLEATINEFFADADANTGAAKRYLDPQIRTSIARLGIPKVSV